MFSNVFYKFCIFISFAVSLSVFADTQDHDELLKKVVEEGYLETEEFKQRERQFQQKKNEQSKRLRQAQQELKREERINERLQVESNKYEEEIATLENEKNIAVGALGEVFGVVKQVAGDLRGQVLNSVISAEIPGREKFVENIAASKKLPTTKELRRLWFEIQREITEQGKVTQFTADVISVNGDKTKELVTRVGPFNLVHDGKYLSYKGDVNKITTLVKQPDGRFTSTINDLENAKEGYVAFSVDPSKGSLISILIRTPGLWERIKQGGWIGFLIICVLLFGLGLVLQRFLIIRKEKLKIMAQVEGQQVNGDNPIGQIMKVYENNKHLDLESLELKLDEIVIAYLPKVEKGIGTIKLLAVLSPLMGLLGTVTGMILTFQSITLFGTGDPKFMADGISQALMTTVLGLICAIPLLLLHNVISNMSQGIIQILEERVAGLLAQRMMKSSGESKSEG